MDLKILEFMDQEVFDCTVHDAHIIVYASMQGNNVPLLLDTGAANDVVLALWYVQQRQIRFDYEGMHAPAFDGRPQRAYGWADVNNLHILGRELGPRRVGVADILREGNSSIPIAGLLGAEFFRDSILAVDMRNSEIAFSTQARQSNCAARANHELTLRELAAEWVPVTHDIRDVLFPGGTPPTLVLDTGSKYTHLTLDYVRREKTNRISRWVFEQSLRHRRSAYWLCSLPNGTEIKVLVRPRKPSTSFANSLGLDQIDGTIGLDFLGRWISVWDLLTGA